MEKDGLLYVNARGFALLYNILMIALMWLTRKRRSGHWYFDAVTLTEPKK